MVCNYLSAGNVLGQFVSCDPFGDGETALTRSYISPGQERRQAHLLVERFIRRLAGETSLLCYLLTHAPLIRLKLALRNVKARAGSRVKSKVLQYNKKARERPLQLLPGLSCSSFPAYPSPSSTPHLTIFQLPVAVFSTEPSACMASRKATSSSVVRPL
jgi:hypothetical protein